MHETRVLGYTSSTNVDQISNFHTSQQLCRGEKYFYNLWIRVDGVCSLFLKLYTIRDTKRRRSRIVSAKYRETSTAQNDGKMCKQCFELTETYRDEEMHPRYHVCYNDDKNNSKISQRLVYTRILTMQFPN